MHLKHLTVCGGSVPHLESTIPLDKWECRECTGHTRVTLLVHPLALCMHSMLRPPIVACAVCQDIGQCAVPISIPHTLYADPIHTTQTWYSHYFALRPLLLPPPAPILLISGAGLSPLDLGGGDVEDGGPAPAGLGRDQGAAGLGTGLLW